MIKKRFRRAFSPSTYHILTCFFTKKKQKKRCVSLQYVMSMSSKIQNFKTVHKKYWGLSREEIVKKKKQICETFISKRTDYLPFLMPCKHLLCILNPFTPTSGQDRISPYNINTISSRQVMRIEKNINYGIIS